MKKFLLVLLAATATLSFTGCQKEDNSQKAEEAELDAVSSSLSGTLVKYTGTEISIETSEGETLSFDNCEKAQLDLENGIVPGNEVTLMYVGAIEDTNTNKVKVRKITATADNSSVLALAKKAEESIPNSTGSPIVLEEDDKNNEEDDKQQEIEKQDDKKEKPDEKVPSKENDKKGDNEEDEKEETNGGEFAVGDSKETTIASSVYVRAEPKSGSEILGTLYTDAAVTITNIDGSGWYEVDFEGQKGYIWKDYVN